MSVLRYLYFFQGRRYTSFGKNILLLAKIYFSDKVLLWVTHQPVTLVWSLWWWPYSVSTYSLQPSLCDCETLWRYVASSIPQWLDWRFVPTRCSWVHHRPLCRGSRAWSGRCPVICSSLTGPVWRRAGPLGCAGSCWGLRWFWRTIPWSRHGWRSSEMNLKYNKIVMESHTICSQHSPLHSM